VRISEFPPVAAQAAAAAPPPIGHTLRGIRVDDWVFGVSSVSEDGHESPGASAVPGGAFGPYTPPPGGEQ
ncbi:MAG: hypothetical protein ACXWUZ_17445, partial [Allosphingosinicella sp.]